MTVGERIRFFRMKQDMTQAELAERAGMSCSQISQWERGKCVPYLANARKLAAALGTTTYIILKGE